MARVGERRVLGQEPIAGVDRPAANAAADVQDGVRAKVAVPCCGAADAERLVGQAYVLGGPWGVGGVGGEVWGGCGWERQGWVRKRLAGTLGNSGSRTPRGKCGGWVWGIQQWEDT